MSSSGVQGIVQLSLKYWSFWNDAILELGSDCGKVTACEIVCYVSNGPFCEHYGKTEVKKRTSHVIDPYISFAPDYYVN
jgi:hypothetical protein